MYFSVEWLEEQLKATKDERDQIDLVCGFAFNAIDFLLEECNSYAKKYYDVALKIGSTRGQAMMLMCMSYYQRETGNITEADQLLDQTEALFESDSEGDFGPALSYFAVHNWILGKREKAFKQAFHSRQFAEKNNSNYDLTWSSYQFGVFYTDLKNYEVALQHFREAELRARSQGDTYALARCLSGIAFIEIQQGNFEEALQINAESLENYKKCGHKTGESRALNDLGVLYKKLKQDSEAEKYLTQALELRMELKYIQGIITSQLELAELHLQNGKTGESKKLLESALKLSEESGAKLKESRCNKMLYEVYKKEHDAEKALFYFEKFFEVESLISGEATSNRISSLQQKYATEKSEQEAEIHRLKNVELKKLNEEIEEKNKNILDSIHYAKRIQDSLLPNMKYIERNLKK
ncbi:MAG: tetratricopeptide repeat protein [Bacteroidetes bacterium]|nr:tetratricopeptide repeat protein [Bacteroidota bacterium]